mmetsp:Transcript_17177/g.36873  ORF Transcript_17177/g.36873 Transcript_17177/m.36873 type:complete len:200 (-) Transcript_17177:82-681(-)
MPFFELRETPIFFKSMPDTRGTRPVATSRQSPVTEMPSPSPARQRSVCVLPSAATEEARARTIRTPSAPSKASIASPAAASSAGSNLGATIVTCAPSREKACPSSQPMGPPPTMVIAVGSSSREKTCSYVMYGTLSSPSIFGTDGMAPLAMMTPAFADTTRDCPALSVISTVRGSRKRAMPEAVSIFRALSASGESSSV